MTSIIDVYAPFFVDVAHQGRLAAAHSITNQKVGCRPLNPTTTILRYDKFGCSWICFIHLLLDWPVDILANFACFFSWVVAGLVA